MVTIQQKKEAVASLVEKLGRAQGYYLIGFETMTVEQTINFRRRLKEKGLEFVVAKNTSLKIAVKQAGVPEIPNEDYFGQSGFVFAYDDALAPAKIIKELFDKTEKPRLKAAIVEGQYFNGKQLNVLATLPSKPELIASILGSLNAPVSGIVGAINATMRDMISVIEEVAKKNVA